MATPGGTSRSIVRLALLAGAAAVPISPSRPSPTPAGSTTPTSHAAPSPEECGPARPTALDAAPPEVRALLACVLERLPEAGAGASGFECRLWEHEGRPTRAMLGLKAVEGLDPDRLIARVLDVDGYEGRIAHVVACRARPSPTPSAPGSVRLYQRVAVPGVARVQQELAMVDAGTIRGYRVAYWSLLRPETDALDPGDGARSDFNVGAWLAAPGVVGYAVSCGPRREDVNLMQWLSLTAGADAMAGQVVESAIDSMASWSMHREGSGRDQPSPATRITSTALPPSRRTMATIAPPDQAAGPDLSPPDAVAEGPGPGSAPTAVGAGPA